MFAQNLIQESANGRAPGCVVRGQRAQRCVRQSPLRTSETDRAVAGMGDGGGGDGLKRGHGES